MIVTELLKERSDGIRLMITKSTNNKYIKNVDTNEIYKSAIDPEGFSHQYEETDKDIIPDVEYIDDIFN